MTSDARKTLWQLSVAQFCAMLIWYNYSAVLPIVRQEWSLTDTMAGRILAVFQAGYAIAVVFAGWASDRWGARRVFAFSALETGIFGCLFPLLAHDYESALWLRGLAGLGQGGLYVPGIRLLCEKCDGKARYVAIAVYTTSLVAAYATAYFVAAPAASVYGWRPALVGTSVWAFAAAILVGWFVREAPPRGVAHTRGAISFANRRAWLVIAAYTGHMWELYAVWGWMGAFLTAHLRAARGMDLQHAVGSAGLASGVAIIAGGLAPLMGAWLANRRGFTFAASTLALTGSAVAVVIGWLLTAPTPVLLGVTILYSVIATADSSIYKAELSEAVSPEQLGTFLGLQSFVGFGITVVSTATFGWILQASSWGVAFSMLAVGGVVAVTAVNVARSETRNLERVQLDGRPS